MSKQWLLVGSVCTLVVLVLIYHRALPERPSVPSTMGTEEDPDARARWEWMRLRSPRTGTIPEGIRERELAFAEHLPVRFRGLGKQGDVQIEGWTSRGPYNVGGRTRALAIDVTNEQVLIAGGVSGGLWRSEDGGQTWTKTTRPGQLHSVTTVAQDTRSGKTHLWYAGTGELTGNSAGGGGAPYRGNGLFKSTDGGRTWEAVMSTASDTPERFDSIFDYVWRVAVDPSAPATEDEVYAATYGAIVRTTDGWQSWEAVLTSGESPWSAYTDVAVTSQGVVYATLSSEGTKKGIWRSTDGVNWVNITPSDWPQEYERIVLAVAPSNENVVYFLARTPGVGVNGYSFWKYTYISGDGSGAGGQWEDRSANLPDKGGLNGTFSGQGNYDLVVAVKPDDEEVVIFGGVNLYRTSNGLSSATGTTRIGGYLSKDTYGSYGNHHADQHAVVFYPSNPKRVLSGHDGGVSRTEDVMRLPVVWTSLNRGYLTTQFYSVCIDETAKNDPVVLGGMQDNGTWGTNSWSGEAAWRDVFGGDGGWCEMSPGRIYTYVSSQNGQAYRFRLDDNFNTVNWTRIDPAGGTGYLFINPLVLDPNNDRRIYYPAGSVLWRNDDVTKIPNFRNDAATTGWVKLTKTQLSSGKISAIAVAKTPANRVYYGTSSGSRLYRLDDAHLDASTPVSIKSPDFPSNAYVSSIAVDPRDGNRVLVAFSNYEVISIWFSEDAGASWVPVSGNLEEQPDGSGSGPSVRWVDILPLADGETLYFAGTSTGLYSTTTLDSMDTVWMQEGPSTIGNVVVDMVRSRETDGTVIVGTHGNGVYMAQAVSTAAEEEAPLISTFALEATYPNPFTEVTTIPYRLATGGPVEVEVYDLQGRRVVTLVRQEQAPGTYQVQWNGRDALGNPVAGGTYVIRVQAGGRILTRKVVLFR